MIYFLVYVVPFFSKMGGLFSVLEMGPAFMEIGMEPYELGLFNILPWQ